MTDGHPDKLNEMTIRLTLCDANVTQQTTLRIDTLFASFPFKIAYSCPALSCLRSCALIFSRPISTLLLLVSSHYECSSEPCWSSSSTAFTILLRVLRLEQIRLMNESVAIACIYALSACNAAQQHNRIYLLLRPRQRCEVL